MIIYRPSDRIPIKLGKITLIVSPLTDEQNRAMLSLAKMEGGEERNESLTMAHMTLKSCIKGLKCTEAVTFADGSAFKLKFDDNGELTDDTLANVFLLLGSGKLTWIASQIISSNMDDHKVLGVKFELNKVITSKKKKARSQSRLAT